MPPWTPDLRNWNVRPRKALEPSRRAGYLRTMTTVEEIERAIENLQSEDVAKLKVWLWKRDHDQWDRQMQEDEAAGRLDFLFEEVDAERKAGKLRDWPPPRG